MSPATGHRPDLATSAPAEPLRSIGDVNSTVMAGVTAPATISTVPFPAPTEQPCLLKHPWEKRRIFVKFMSDNIPGPPQRRPTTLGQAFCRKFLGRNFENGQRDSIYVSPLMDVPHSPCWMIIDLNVGKDGLDIKQIPYTCVNAKYLDEDTP